MKTMENKKGMPLAQTEARREPEMSLSERTPRTLVVGVSQKLIEIIICLFECHILFFSDGCRPSCPT